MRKQEILKHRNNESLTKSDKFQYRLVTDEAVQNGLTPTQKVRKRYRSKGAKFMSDLKTVKFTPGKRVAVSENKSAGMNEKSWGPYRKGVVVGDYPLFVQINHETSWNNVCYSKKDILIGRVRIKRQEEYEDKIS